MGMLDSTSLVLGSIGRGNNIAPDMTDNVGISIPSFRYKNREKLSRLNRSGTWSKAGKTDWVKYAAQGKNGEVFQVLLIGSEKSCQSIRITLSSNLGLEFDYFEARSGINSLQIIGVKKLDLIIFSEGIVDMDGLEFLGRLNHKCGKQIIPVIEILNSDALMAGVQAMKMGAHDYLLKDANGHHFELLPILVSRIYTEMQTTKVLQQAAGIHQTITDSIPSVIYQLSLQGGRHNIRISPQIAELGLTSDKWGNDAELHHQMCHVDDRPGVRMALEHSYSTGENFLCDYRIAALGNTLCWFRDRAKVVMDQYGRPLFLQGVMTDITSQKLLETEIAQYRSVLDKLVAERTDRLNRRVAILESCNLNLGDNNHQLHQKYIALLNKVKSYEDESGTKWNA